MCAGSEIAGSCASQSINEYKRRPRSMQTGNEREENGRQLHQSFFLCAITYINNIKRGDYGGREAEAG